MHLTSSPRRHSSSRDRSDVAAVLEQGLVDRSRLREEFAAIEDQPFRVPAVDPATFRAAAEDVTCS